MSAKDQDFTSPSGSDGRQMATVERRQPCLRGLTDGFLGLGFVFYHLTLLAPEAGLALAKDVLADITVILESRISGAFDQLIVQGVTFLFI
jgi:hypothetical protein